MLLYLVRHADALSDDEDPARRLSEKGIQRIKKVASYMAELNIEVNRIFHSKKLRTMQTAQVLTEYIKIEGGISETDGLAPMDDPPTPHYLNHHS
ncbi:MAG: histidine phosphatase family protein, partial [Candidatus Mariimomonas ferrooxydans]